MWVVPWGWIAGGITAGVLMLDLYCWLTDQQSLTEWVKAQPLGAVLPFLAGILVWHLWGK